VFYFEAKEVPGWRVVLKKDVRRRRVLPNELEDVEAPLFEMGHDNDFDGLQLEREVGEEPMPFVGTGQNVVVEPVRRPRRGSGRAGVRVNNQRVCNTRRRQGLQTVGATSGSDGNAQRSSDDVDEQEEEENLFRNNLGNGT